MYICTSSYYQSKIYSVCNVNYKLIVELQSTYRITALKASKKRLYVISLGGVS